MSARNSRSYVCEIVLQRAFRLAQFDAEVNYVIHARDVECQLALQLPRARAAERRQQIAFRRVVIHSNCDCC